MNLTECARDPCFDVLTCNGKEIGRCMKEKNHRGSCQCIIYWDK